jgi:hypothetical protein
MKPGISWAREHNAHMIRGKPKARAQYSSEPRYFMGKSTMLISHTIPCTPEARAQCRFDPRYFMGRHSRDKSSVQGTGIKITQIYIQ